MSLISIYKGFLDFDIIFKKYGIKYWFCKGILLGVVWYSGYNFFDDDVDICIKIDY